MSRADCQAGELAPPVEEPVERRWLQRLVEPPVLFIAIGALVLTVIWVTTLNLAASERAAAERTAAVLAGDLADTYEAQVVRALREIDHALRLVRYNLETGTAGEVLSDLRAQGLLPPELLFTVRITDAAGNVIASTRPPAAENVSAFGFFQRARGNAAMVVGEPRYDPEADEWRLHFSRRLRDAGAHFAGIVTVSVHAGYFVSGYEPNVLGDHGVLGLVGTDGIFRARRTGDVDTAGKQIDYESLVPDDGAVAAPPTVRTNGWDGMKRYTVARKLFDFPLAIVVGLSKAEQLAPAVRLERTYRARAGAASVGVIVVVVLLGRLGSQLQRTRVRAMEERVEHAQRVEYLARHDGLTDLPNRVSFSQLLTQNMQRVRRRGRRLALLFLDLDRFKTINDSFGHEAGDELLQEISGRLRECVRESDIVARLGGDEFVILLPEIASGKHAVPVAEKVLSAVSRPFNLAGQEFRVTVSIGVTTFPDDGEDEQTLMKNADIAMYHAKEQGKNNFQFYSRDLQADSLEWLALESSLRRALERGEFRLFYQAKRDFANDVVTGMEALVRWDHPDIGLIAPRQFIRLAEETGLIVPLGRWVLETACRQNVAWQKEGYPASTMAVNLSARQFIDERLLADVKSALRRAGMDPTLLELEITESMIMRDMERTIVILKELKKMGVKVAIDDFGTGYSSLSYLKQFPLDTLKIDSSFIRDVVRSAEDQYLTEAVIAMGKSLNLTVVAEGVETADQAEFLRRHGCDQFQGFYINEPMPAEELVELVYPTRRGRAAN